MDPIVINGNNRENLQLAFNQLVEHLIRLDETISGLQKNADRIENRLQALEISNSNQTQE